MLGQKQFVFQAASKSQAQTPGCALPAATHSRPRSLKRGADTACRSSLSDRVAPGYGLQGQLVESSTCYQSSACRLSSNTFAQVHIVPSTQDTSFQHHGAARRVRASVAAHVASTEMPDHDISHVQEVDLVQHHHTPLAEPQITRVESVPVVGDRELYDEIKGCETWEDVLEVVADEAHRLSLHTATQACSRLVALSRQSKEGQAKTLAKITSANDFAKLLRILAVGIPRMNCAQLCNSTHALAQLRARLPESMLVQYAAQTRQLSTELNARDISQLLHGWATMKFKPGVKTLDLVGFRAKVLLDEGAFEPQSLSMMLHSLAQLEYKNNFLLTAAATEVAVRMSEFTPQGVANCTWALAKLGHYSNAMLTSAAAAYCKSPESYKTQEVCNILWAFAKQRWHPQETLSVMVRSLVKRSSTLRPADFAMLFYCLGTFGVHPGKQLLSELLGPLERRLPQFSAQELCNVYWGLGLLGETGQAVCVKIAALIPDLYEANRLDEGLLRQVFQTFLCTKLAAALDEVDGRAPRKAPVFPPLMMQAMKQAWIRSVQSGAEAAAAATEKDNNSRSSNQTEQPGSPARQKRRSAKDMSVKEEVSAIIKSLGVTHQTSRVTKDSLAAIDIALKAGQDRYIALQVVMEHEHTSNTGQFLGPLQFQTQVIEMNGWEVRHIRAKDLKALAPTSKPLFIADLLRSIGVRVARGSASNSGNASKGLDLVMSEDANSNQTRRRKSTR